MTGKGSLLQSLGSAPVIVSSTWLSPHRSSFLPLPASMRLCMGSAPVIVSSNRLLYLTVPSSVVFPPPPSVDAPLHGLAARVHHPDEDRPEHGAGRRHPRPPHGAHPTAQHARPGGRRTAVRRRTRHRLHQELAAWRWAREPHATRRTSIDDPRLHYRPLPRPGD